MENDTRAGRELVDVIDACGRTIRVVTRAQMRALHLPHRCVYLLVFNRSGELFVHLRTAGKDVCPAHWDVCVGGVLAAGESYEQGMRREVWEELGVEVAAQELFPFHYEDVATSVEAMVYSGVHDGPFQLQPAEIVRGEFVSLAEIDRRKDEQPFCPDGLAVLAEYRRRQGVV